MKYYRANRCPGPVGYSTPLLNDKGKWILIMVKCVASQPAKGTDLQEPDSKYQHWPLQYFSVLFILNPTTW